MGATEDAAARSVIAGQKPEGIAGWGTSPRFPPTRDTDLLQNDDAQRVSFAAAPGFSSLGEPPISPTPVGGLRTPQPVAPPPPQAATAPPRAEPELVVETQAAPEPTPQTPLQPPTPTPAVRPVQVQVRLSNGERIVVGSFPSQEAAKSKARQMTRELEESRVWPFLDGRFIRPDAIVSIDLDDLTAF